MYQDELMKNMPSEAKFDGAAELKQRPLSFGEKAVGLTFNPGGNAEVDAIKRAFANTIDILDTLRGVASSQEKKRQFSIAITDAQSAQMWAVKAVTWKD